MSNGEQSGPHITRGVPKKYDPDMQPVHSTVVLTVRQLADPALTAYEMHLQGFGVNVIAKTLALPVVGVWTAIQEKELV